MGCFYGFIFINNLFLGQYDIQFMFWLLNDSTLLNPKYYTIYNPYYLRCLTQISFFKNEGFPEPTHSLSRDVTKKELIEKYKI